MAISKAKSLRRRRIPGTCSMRSQDDLNTPKAIAELHELHSAGHWAELRDRRSSLLGFSGDRQSGLERVQLLVRCMDVSSEARESTRGRGRRAMIDARNAAREAKDFAKRPTASATSLRAMGITLKDAKDPKTGELVTTWEVAR